MRSRSPASPVAGFAEPEAETGPVVDGVIEDPLRRRRRDRFLLLLLSLLAASELITIPLRVCLLGHPLGWSLYNGSETALVLQGAQIATGHSGWLASLLLGTFGGLWHLLLWWYLGVRCGPDFLTRQLDRLGVSPRWRELTERGMRRSVAFAIFLCSLPGVPVPPLAVAFLLAESGVSLRRFLTRCLAGLLPATALNLWLGWYFGTDIEQAVDVAGRYFTPLTLLLLAWCGYRLARTWWRRNTAR